MARIFQALSRRSLLKLLLALPFVKLVERYLGSMFGRDPEAAVAEKALRVAKVSELKEPWSSTRFTYLLKVKAKDVYKGEVDTVENVPGLVIRLPDALAEKRGGGMKEKFYVVNLHCTHERCLTGYITDKSEVRGVADIEVKNPVAYCPCHRSVFDLAEGGKPIKGPAKEPLWKFDFDIKGDDIVVTGADPKASVWEPGRLGGLTVEYPVRRGEPGL